MVKISTQSRKDLFIHIGIILALIAVLFLGFFFIYLPFTTNHGESITVPDLKEMKVEDLESYLDSHDLRYEVSDCTFVANMPPLSVISQYPKPGSKVKENRKIYVTVSSRTAPLIKMPKLTDMTRKSAEMLLKSVGLELGTLTYVPDLAQNAVLKQLLNGQEILAGQPVAKGSKIDLEVGDGLGNNSFQVPALVGMQYEEAKFQIIGAGLKPGQTIEVKDDTQAAGTVIRQNPEAGNKIRVGDVIDLWVVGPLDQAQPENNEQALPE